MADEADIANEYQAKWLAAQLEEHAYQLNKRSRDTEAEICNGCQYATKASWGKTCDSWHECREDLDRQEKAKKRSGE